MYQKLALYINGQFIEAEGRTTQEVVNPSNKEVLGHLPHATNDDLELALVSAERAFVSWKKSSPTERLPFYVKWLN